MELILTLVVVGLVGLFLYRIFFKHDTFEQAASEIKNEVVADVKKVEEAVKCGCGRSPTGDCIGWHGLSDEQLKQAKKEYESEGLFQGNISDFIKDAYKQQFAPGGLEIKTTRPPIQTPEEIWAGTELMPNEPSYLGTFAGIKKDWTNDELITIIQKLLNNIIIGVYGFMDNEKKDDIIQNLTSKGFVDNFNFNIKRMPNSFKF